MAAGDVSLTFTLPSTALPYTLITDGKAGAPATLSGGAATAPSAKAAPAGSPGKAA